MVPSLVSLVVKKMSSERRMSLPVGTIFDPLDLVRVTAAVVATVEGAEVVCWEVDVEVIDNL